MCESFSFLSPLFHLCCSTVIRSPRIQPNSFALSLSFSLARARALSHSLSLPLFLSFSLALFSPPSAFIPYRSNQRRGPRTTTLSLLSTLRKATVRMRMCILHALTGLTGCFFPFSRSIHRNRCDLMESSYQFGHPMFLFSNVPLTDNRHSWI